MFCFDENFFEIRRFWLVGGEFGLVEKKHVLVNRRKTLEIFNKFESISANAGEGRGKHSAVDADAHVLGLFVRIKV